MATGEPNLAANLKPAMLRIIHVLAVGPNFMNTYHGLVSVVVADVEKFYIV